MDNIVSDVEVWLPMPEIPTPVLYENFILVKHEYGIDAIYFHGGSWRFWYSNIELNRKQLDDIFKTATHFMPTGKL